MKILLILFGAFLCAQNVSAADIPHNFQQAKVAMAGIYQDHQKTLYCGCKFSFNKNGKGPGGKIDATSCPYDKSGAILYWEHIVPASLLGQNLSCWKVGHDDCVKYSASGTAKAYKGRKCCQKVDENFILMAADLYNLAPAIDELNRARSNYPFSDEVVMKARFGACEFNVDKKTRVALLPNHLKGFIARTYLQITKKYQIPIPNDELSSYQKWVASFPKTVWEITRYERIQTVYNQQINQVVKTP